MSKRGNLPWPAYQKPVAMAMSNDVDRQHVKILARDK